MKLLTYKTAAEILDCSASKVQKLCLAGEIPILKVGNETRIREEDLERWIEQRRYYHEPKNCRDDSRKDNQTELNPTTETFSAKG